MHWGLLLNFHLFIYSFIHCVQTSLLSTCCVISFVLDSGDKVDTILQAPSVKYLTSLWIGFSFGEGRKALRDFAKTGTG